MKLTWMQQNNIVLQCAKFGRLYEKQWKTELVEELISN